MPNSQGCRKGYEEMRYLGDEECCMSREESSEVEGAGAMRFTRHETRIRVSERRRILFKGKTIKCRKYRMCKEEKENVVVMNQVANRSLITAGVGSEP